MTAEATLQQSPETESDVCVQRYFQAVAVDYDGTLTTGGRPHENVLEALARARSRGVKIVLATGRIVSELREVFPDFSRHFDAVVAENGAVLADANGGTRAIAARIPGLLERRLVDRGVVLRRGDVILATSSYFDATVIEEIMPRWAVYPASRPSEGTSTCRCRRTWRASFARA